MTPREFANEIVVPTVREFRDAPRSRRMAYLACIVTYSLRDYLGKAEVENTMKLDGRSRAFEAVRAVCNGAKHRDFSGSSKYPENIPFSVGDDYERLPCVGDLAVADLSIAGDGAGGREIAENLGGIDLYQSVKSVLKAYELYFDHLLRGIKFRDC